jgi:exopolyphosphatase/guanosine-5'-triphosphate,3'-diphosphate pyrophosphatase
VRSACVDIGSNTTRLLIAELRDGALCEVAAQRVFHRLRGDMAPDAVREVATTVAAQIETARAAGAEDVVVVGTAAIRNSSSGPGICDAVRDACGVGVTVLSPADEARLAFLGATHTVAEPPDGFVAVVDVGGGSSEIVCGTCAGDVSWSVSLPLGSGTLADDHLAGDPPTADELVSLRASAAAAFAGVTPPSEVVAAYAVGGNATSLRRLLGRRLDRAALTRAIDVVCSAPAADVAREHDLHLDRVRVLPAGMILLDEAAALLGLSLEIVCGGLREGVILERLRANPH